MTAITGTAITPAGAIKPSAMIIFRRARLDVSAQGGGFVIPDDITVLSDSSGDVSFDILPGKYIGSTVAIGNRAVQFDFNVADVAYANFEDCIGAARLTTGSGHVSGTDWTPVYQMTTAS